MKAARIHVFGGAVEIDDVDAPVPGPGESVVRLRVVALNPLDLWVKEGSVAGGSQQLPFVLGTEGVGMVEGRRVLVGGAGLGTVRDGLLREAAAVPTECITDVPAAIEDVQAAAISVVGVTAKRILDLAETDSGEIVVVLGASGGVGSVAVQIAKSRGATVVAATSSPEKRAWLEQFGPDLVVGVHDDIPQALNEAFGRLADVALNPLAGEFVRRAVAMLAPGGRQVLFGRSAGDLACFDAADFYRKGVSILGYGGLADDPEKARSARVWLFDQVARGSLRIPVGLELPLARAADGLDLIRDGKVHGKVVVRVDEA